VDIKCAGCDTVNNVSVKNLVRKWADELYLCKSCHVKTYVNNIDRIDKWRKKFSKIAATKEHKERCSRAAKKVWASPILSANIRKSSHVDTPAKKAARVRAVAGFMKKHGKKRLAEMRAAQRSKPSILEDIVASVLSGYGVSFVRQYSLGYYIYDFLIPSHNLIIEVNGEYWHKDTGSVDSAKASYAGNNGHIVKCIWENEFSELGKVDNIIKEWLGIKEPEQINFCFNDVCIGVISNLDARKFLGRYHYLPAISKFGVHYGAFLNGCLIACVTFSYVVRQQTAVRLFLSNKQVREVSRFCIASAYHKKNFASWFLCRAVKEYSKSNVDIICLVSFSDSTLHNGTLYKAANWEHDGSTDETYMYRSHDGFLAHKKTIWDRAKKIGLSEQDYAIKHNYIKVWSKPKDRYLLWLRK
jgi:very-short-patch-repair endonuclease